MQEGNISHIWQNSKKIGGDETLVDMVTIVRMLG